eukprot:g4133.t1
MVRCRFCPAILLADFAPDATPDDQSDSKYGGADDYSTSTRFEFDYKNSGGKYNRAGEYGSPEERERRVKPHFWVLEGPPEVSSRAGKPRDEGAQPGDLLTVRVESVVNADSGEEVVLGEIDKKQSFKLNRNYARENRPGGEEKSTCVRQQNRKVHIGCLPFFNKAMEKLKFWSSDLIICIG